MRPGGLVLAFTGASGYTFCMEASRFPCGGLVQHRLRLGVWRLVVPAIGQNGAVIEPWDDAAAATLHAAEAYEITVPRRLLRRIEPGGADLSAASRRGQLLGVS